MKYTLSKSGGKRERDCLEIHQVRFEVLDLPSFLQELRMLGIQYGCSLICFNRQVMAGRRHVIEAVLHAQRSFQSGDPIARSIEVEALLYAAGTRQTGFISPFGIHTGFNECFLCIIPRNPDAAEKIRSMMEYADDEDWEEITAEKRAGLQRLFSITKEELQVTGIDRLEDLVLERVALLIVNR